MTTWTPHILLKHHNRKLIPFHRWWKQEKPPWISLLNGNNNNEIWKKEQRQRKASNCWRHQAEKLVSIRICVTDKYFMHNLSLIVMDKGTLRWFLSIAYAFCTAHKNNVIRPYFLLHNFGVQITPFKLRKLTKNYLKGKKIKLKACTKPVTRLCKLWPWKERVEKRFESMSFKFA